MDKVRKTIEVVAGMFFAFVAVITLLGAASRLLPDIALPDGNEIARTAQGIAVLWGIAVASFDGRHVSVDILYEKLFPKGRKALDLFGTGVVALFMTLAAYKTIGRGIEAMNSGLTTNELRIALGPYWLLAAIGLGAAALLTLVRFIYILQGNIK